MASKTKKTSSKEVKQKQKAAKAQEPPAGSRRAEGYLGKINGTDSEDGPTISGTNVLVADVLNDLDMGDSVETVCEAYGIEPEDVAACKAWRDKPEGERDEGKPCVDDLPASEPPNPDEPHELEEDEAVEPEALPMRKVEISTLIPGASVLERIFQTVAVPLTVGEIAAKERDVLIARKSVKRAKAELNALKDRIKSIEAHEQNLLDVLECGQEERSLECERVLEGMTVNLYRLDKPERPIESRPARSDERQLTIGGVA